MKKLGLITAVTCAFVLSLILFGCGGGSQGKTTSDYLGTWTLDSVDSTKSDNAVDHDKVSSLKDGGTELTLTFSDDGMVAVTMSGSTASGKWKVDESGSSMTIGSSEMGLSMQNSQIRISDGDDTLVFSKVS